MLLSLNSFSQQGILGANVSDGLPRNPSLLTWTKVHEERFLNAMDENHVHYTSDFTTSTSNLSAVSGSAPSIAGGNLVISGSVKYRSTSNPIAAWTTAELTIAAMGSAGDSNKLGPCIIKDATHYIAAVYDKIGGRVQVVQNDIVLISYSLSLNTNNLKIYLLVSGNSLSFFYKESGGDLTCGFVVPSVSLVDMKSVDMTEYKYGVYCLQSGGTTTHNVTSLRGAASGGVGLYNDKIVRNEDGSEFLLAGKLIMTADISNPSPLGGNSYIDINSVVLSIDTATFDVEIIGRFYFDRSSKRLGGADLHVIFNGSQWLITYVPVDNTGGVDGGTDYYFYLDYADLFTENVIDEADLTHITFNGTSDAYDVSTRLIGGEYKSAVTRGFGAGRAGLYSGTDFDNMDFVSGYNDGIFYESGGWIRYRHHWYLMYSTFGNTKQIVLSYPDLNLVGYMDLPFITDTYIPGYDWYCKQVNGTTIYYMIGFDTNLFLGFPWALGRLVVWKATETKNGYEF